MTDKNRALDNAKAWAGSIAEMVAALECDYDRLEELRTMDANDISAEEGEELHELREASTIDGDAIENAEAARERITESPLSVQVRSGWADPGAEMVPEEFEILLTTGGPAARIRGELDDYKQPRRAWLEYQDWGTGWMQHFPDNLENADLLTFCQQFYFGD